MDAITILRDDHDKVRKLFTAFERLDDGASAKKQELTNRIIEELTVHTYIEEELFYPAVQRLRADGKGDTPEDMIKEAEEEHAQVKRLLAELDQMTPADDRFDAKVTVVIDDVRHHAEEEEQEMFPKVREAMGRSDLRELGERMLVAKGQAPRRPSDGA